LLLLIAVDARVRIELVLSIDGRAGIGLLGMITLRFPLQCSTVGMMGRTCLLVDFQSDRRGENVVRRLVENRDELRRAAETRCECHRWSVRSMICEQKHGALVRYLYVHGVPSEQWTWVRRWRTSDSACDRHATVDRFILAVDLCCSHPPTELIEFRLCLLCLSLM
jgi:hypothetical protein